MIRLAVVEDQTLTRETTVERVGARFGTDADMGDLFRVGDLNERLAGLPRS